MIFHPIYDDRLGAPPCYGLRSVGTELLIYQRDRLPVRHAVFKTGPEALPSVSPWRLFGRTETNSRLLKCDEVVGKDFGHLFSKRHAWSFSQLLCGTLYGLQWPQLESVSGLVLWSPEGTPSQVLFEHCPKGLPAEGRTGNKHSGSFRDHLFTLGKNKLQDLSCPKNPRLDPPMGTFI